MLAITPSNSSTRRNLTPNLLPASIQHNGPIPFESRYWNPQPLKPKDTQASSTQQEQQQPKSDAPTSQSSQEISQNSTTQEAYFRGRRLLGRRIALPDGYEGIVLEKTEKKVPGRKPTVEELRRMEEDWDEDDGGVGEKVEDVEVKLLEERGRFGEVVVWGHEALPELEREGVMRGLGEWIGFAEAIHGYRSSTEQDEQHSGS